MKTLLFILLLLVPLFADSTTKPSTTPSIMECEMILAMFDFSVEQGNPVTKEQLTGAIEACEPFTKHKGIVTTMKATLKAL